MAGVCAAISAARLGARVALVHNRPVLGGNASSEIRVWVCGATSHGIHQFARETGVMGELFVENQYRNPDGNPVYWDLVVLEAVRREPNITLYLNTDVRDVAASGSEADRRIHSVTGWMMGSERAITFSSPIFLDCTGDGLVGFMAGARYRVGRESADEFGESLAPPIADDVVMGSTIVFYTKDVGHPIKYIPPDFAKDITTTTIPEQRIIRAGDNGAAYWWIEWGGELDTVHDNEVIRDELWSVIYGIWDYIKNSGKFDAETMTLEWVGAVPGKREYRRFVGDYTLTQDDILRQTQFVDRVAFGGWSIDLHAPQGMYAEKANLHWHSDGIYHLPLRCLYSVNVSNLLFAGRNVSASHVAFGGTRVMATCAVLGQAAGSTAALSATTGYSPREIATKHLDLLQRIMLRQDASIIGLAYQDPDDVAPTAHITASSTRNCLAVMPSSTDTERSVWRLETDAGLVVPVDSGIDGFELLVDSDDDTSMTVRIFDIGLGENYLPRTQVSGDTISVPAGKGQWTRFSLAWQPDSPANAFIVVDANPKVGLRTAAEVPFGVVAFSRQLPDPGRDHEVLPHISEWRTRPLHRQMFCFRLPGTTRAYLPEKVIDGYLRPFAGPHVWTSGPITEQEPAWLQLAWPAPETVDEISLTFNDDVNEHLINLHAYHTPFEIPPNLVADYRIQALLADGWTDLVVVDNNRQRRRRHQLNTPVTTEKIRVIFSRTHGVARAEVFAIHCYRSATQF